MLPTISKVAVIGGGAAGLATARRLRLRDIEVTIFERNSIAGGVWIFDEQKPPRPSFPSEPPSAQLARSPRPPQGEKLPFTEYYDDETIWLRHAPTGPCYEVLVTNLEIAMMKFEGHEYPPGTAPYVNHRSILEYLQRFARDFDLDSITQYNTSVEHLEKIKEGNKSLWKLLLRKLSRDHLGRTVGTWSEETFDAVVVASGHYHAEYIPDIPGLSEWAEKWPQGVSHAKEFRHPGGLGDKTVIVVGSNFSSLDIGREMSPFVKHIYRSVRDEEKNPLEIKILRSMIQSLDPDNLTQVAEIERFGPVDHASRARETQIFLKDGTVLEGIDEIIFCTGYLYVLPFLELPSQDLISGNGSEDVKGTSVSEVELITDGMQIHNLHKEIFYIHDPTLAFIGIPYGVAAFPFYDLQAKAVTAVFTGQAALPPVSEMRLEYGDRGVQKGRMAHLMGISREREYVEDIMGWINEGGGTEYDESWHRTRSAALERFLRDRISNRNYYPNLEPRDAEAKVQGLLRAVERMIKGATKDQ